jgi:hypothetical protein
VEFYVINLCLGWQLLLTTLQRSRSLYEIRLQGIDLCICAHAEEKRIYQTDSLGNIQYNKPLYAIQKDGRIVVTDAVGNKQYDKQQYQIKGDKTYSVDSPGNITNLSLRVSNTQTNGVKYFSSLKASLATLVIV